ncbi:ParB/RepB/Spo0J family partition protein [Streptomyces sp. NPDC002835]
MTTVITPTPAETPSPDEDQFEVVRLDPADLERDPCNARTEGTAPDDRLINSVKALGVEDAISVRPLSNGKYGVFKGWRRAQAAQIANETAEADGRPRQTVKAVIRTDLAGRDAWTRFLSLVENDHRSQMEAPDAIRAAELSLVAMNDIERSQAKRALGLKGNAVKSARRAAKLSDAELRKASAEGMDLEQLADLSEVEGVPGALDKLSRAKAADDEEGQGKRGHWDHAMAQLRHRLADSEAKQKAVEALKEAGVPLLRATYGSDGPRPLSELTNELHDPLTEDRHTSCPGHSAKLSEDYQPVWYCSAPKQYGHNIVPSEQEPKNKLSPEESATRRRRIARNKAWAAAQEVRRAEIAKLCRARSLDDKARKFVLVCLMNTRSAHTKFAHSAMDSTATELVAGFLGVDDPNADTAAAIRRSGGPFDELVSQTAKAREWHLLFAQVAAAMEYAIRERNAWQNLSSEEGRWLLLLEDLGYTLSEVEAEAVAQHRPTAPDTKAA